MIECLSSRRFVFARRAAALAIASCALALGASAQQTASASANSAPLLASISSHPMDLATLAGVGYSSSSSSSSDDTAQPADPANLFDSTVTGLQPPPRRRYGRPRYNDSSHNSDGSSKWTGEVGIGFELPTGDTYHYYNTGWAFSGGFGRRFNKKFAVLGQFDYDHFGLNGQTIGNQQDIYNYGCTPQLEAEGECTIVTNLDGNNHVWSFTVDPTYNFYQGDKVGAYVVGGVGFYHKVTNFTLPTTACADLYCYYEYQVNENVDHYTSNAPGFNGGFGLTYKFSRFADETFFIEGRYVFMDNSQRTGVTAQNYQTVETTYTGNNFFPANSNRTTYIPIKVGLRF